MNPISRLAQIQQAKKEKEPEYGLLTERGLPRRREFVIQVSSRGVRHTGEEDGVQSYRSGGRVSHTGQEDGSVIQVRRTGFSHTGEHHGVYAYR